MVVGAGTEIAGGGSVGWAVGAGTGIAGGGLGAG